MERFFFFSSRRRHTRWPRDWSSDVCSSDLHSIRLNPLFVEAHKPWQHWKDLSGYQSCLPLLYLLIYFSYQEINQIGRASCRERENITRSTVPLKTTRSLD